MKDLLSNEEIDTLLELFRAEGAELEEQEIHELQEVVKDVLDGEVTVSPVDLLKPNRFTGDQLDAVERFHAGLAQSLGALLTDRLRLDVVCDCIGVEQLRFGEWLERSGVPAAAWLLSAQGSDSPMPMTVSPTLLHGIVDRILGGRGHAEEPLGEATEAMLTVASSLIDACAGQVCKALGDTLHQPCSLDRRLGTQVLGQIIGGSDVVLAVYMQVSGEELHGDLRLVLPFAQSEALASRLGQSRTPDYDAAPGSARQALAGSLRGVDLEVVGVLGRAEIRLRELLALQDGDVLRLPSGPAAPVEVQVAGRTKFAAAPGRRGVWRALRIEREECDER